MKGMDRISRGSGMRGVVSYILKSCELIGGNMSGQNVKEITAEFRAAQSLRPDVKKHVWHSSLRLPQGDTLPAEKWVEIADDYMRRMGFTDSHQRIYGLDNDPKGQHIHIAATRIGLDSSLYLGKNENLKNTRIIQNLEKDYGLTITKGPDYDSDGKIIIPERKKLTKNEIEKAVRTEEQPIRSQLQDIVEEAIKENPSFSQFIERLESAGVSVRPNMSKGSVSGLSFSLDGVAFSGSKLGSKFTFKNLLKAGLDYDKDRDSQVVERLRAEAGSTEIDPGSTKNHPESEPGNSEDRGRVRPSNDSRVDSSLGADRRDLDIAPEAGKGSTAVNERVSDRNPGHEHSDDAGHSETRAGSEIDTSTEKESEAAAPAADPNATVSKEAPLARYSVPSNESGHGGLDGGGADGGAGEVADTDIIRTGNRAIDELSRAFKNARKKADQEAVEHASRIWSKIPAKPAPNLFLKALRSIASRIFDISTMREREEENRRMQAEALARQTASAEAARQAEIDAAIERNTEKLEQERALDGRAVEDHPEVMSKHKKPKSRYERDEGLSR